MKRRIDELAALMDEFGLAEANLEGEDWQIAFRRHSENGAAGAQEAANLSNGAMQATSPATEQRPAGTPVTSPMNGIFYSTPSPSAPPFVTEGESVTAGQVVGLIEAMKVFNEITAPTSGTIGQHLAENGQLVQPGDVLLYIV